MSCNWHARKRKEADPYLSLSLTVCSGCSQCLPTHLQSASLDHHLQHCWQGKPPAQHLLYLCSCPRRGGGGRRTRSQWLVSRSPGRPWGICTGPELQAGAETRRQSHTHTHTTGVAAQRGHASEYRKNTRWVAGELSLSHGISQSTVEGRRAPNPWFTPKQTLLLYGEQTAVGAALQLPFPPHCWPLKAQIWLWNLKFASIWFAAIGFT